MFTFAVTQGKRGKSPLQKVVDKYADKELVPDSPEYRQFINEKRLAGAHTRQLLALGNISTMLSVSMAGFYMLNLLLAQNEGLDYEQAEQRALSF